MTLILGEGGFIKKFIQPLGPQLGLKISGGGTGPPGWVDVVLVTDSLGTVSPLPYPLLNA